MNHKFGKSIRLMATMVILAIALAIGTSAVVARDKPNFSSELFPTK